MIKYFQKLNSESTDALGVCPTFPTMQLTGNVILKIENHLFVAKWSMHSESLNASSGTGKRHIADWRKMKTVCMPCSPVPICTRLRLPGKGSPRYDKGKVCPFGRKVIESKLKYGFGCPKSASRKECEDILCNTRLKPLIIQRFPNFHQENAVIRSDKLIEKCTVWCCITVNLESRRPIRQQYASVCWHIYFSAGE